MNWKHCSIFLLVLLLASCANRGIGPQGGPKDSIPPVPLHSDPEQGALEFKGKRIEVTFLPAINVAGGEGQEAGELSYEELTKQTQDAIERVLAR